MTEEDNKAINSLHQRYVKKAKIIQAYDSGLDYVDLESNKCKQDIHNTFDEID